jgi:L-2-hydroxycarboxylate dehydrogenase (NAD+)
MSADELRAMVTKALTKAGVPTEDAAIVAEHLAEAHLTGRDIFGISWVPSILLGIRNGMINPKPEIRRLRRVSSTILLDGDHGLGEVAGMKAMQLAIDMAARNGVGLVSLRNCTSLEMLGFYARHAAKQGMIGIVTANAGAAMAPQGGVEPIFGTNPIAIGIPTRGDPLLIDMATSVVAKAKIFEAKERGEKIPLNWAIDAEGKQTDDPDAALKGSLLPMGGVKGYCLAFAIDVLSGGLSASAVGKEVTGTNKVTMTQHTANQGNLLIAINPDAIVGADKYLAAVDRLIEQVRHCRPHEGATIYLPGEIENACRAERSKFGFEVDDELRNQLAAM